MKYVDYCGTLPRYRATRIDSDVFYVIVISNRQCCDAVSWLKSFLQGLHFFETAGDQA